MKKEIGLILLGFFIAVNIWMLIRIRALENFRDAIIINSQRQAQAQQVRPAPMPVQ